MGIEDTLKSQIIQKEDDLRSHNYKWLAAKYNCPVFLTAASERRDLGHLELLAPACLEASQLLNQCTGMFELTNALGGTDNTTPECREIIEHYQKSPAWKEMSNLSKDLVRFKKLSAELDNMVAASMRR